jgi:hypothetical protein
MTDRIIINKFLKRFKVKIQSSNFVIVEKHTNQEFSDEQFSYIFLKIFNTFSIDKNTLSIDLYKSWYKSEKKKHVKKLEQYLENCTVTLGLCDWDVTAQDGTRVTYNSVYRLFSNNFDIEFIDRYYSNWLSEKVIDISESLMNQW